MLGADTLAVEVTHVAKQGFWILLRDEEMYLAFVDFPWFKAATIEQLSDVQCPTPGHLYWPLLDVDLAVESVRNPAAFPLVSRAG